MRKYATGAIVVAAFVLGGLAAALALRAQAPLKTAIAGSELPWREIAWPFPMDQWGKGTAFECGAADCGVNVTVYLRAKIGFCNCSKGMTDDADLDRVSDFELFGGAFYPQAPGQPIAVAWMNGRARPFAIGGDRGERTMLSVGLHDNCDALVITAVLPRGTLAEAEPRVLRFLQGRTVARWAQDTLGL